MERIEDDGKISFKKAGGGCIRWNGMLIKPGQIIRLDPSQVPASYKDLLIPLEKIREKTEPPINVVVTDYKVVPRGKSKSLFDVVDGNGKHINEKALTKKLAEELAKELAE